MLIRDLIDIDLDTLPIIFPDHSVEKARELCAQFPYNVIPVVDHTFKLTDIHTKDLLADATGHMLDVEAIDIDPLQGNDNAIKAKELFQCNDIELMFVVDRNGLLLGAVSTRNPAIKHLNSMSKLAPVPEIFDAMHDAIIIINSETTIIYTNHAYSELIGVPVWKIIGKSMTMVEPTSKCLGVLRGDKPYVNERIRIETVNIEVIATITPIYEGSEKIGVISVFRSIDETIELSRKVERMEYINRYLKDELKLKAKLPCEFNSIIGKNGLLVEVLAKASKVAKTNVNVLILGESGTGKEGLANAIHYASSRRNKPIIRVNCAAIPEALLESELFGYSSGAFTGAHKSGKIGKFELADNGTIFLDEIGDMNLSMQSKLLRVIQEKEIERIGDNKTIRVDVRIVSATNKNLDKMVQEGSFREDLYYRLNVFSIILPPLRERKDDIYLLVDHFAQSIASDKGIDHLYFSKEVMDFFMEYDWKGNIRELQNVVEYASVVCQRDKVYLEDLPSYLLNYRTGISNDTTSSGGNINSQIRELERNAIIKAMKEHNNNKSAAMRTLGISRRTFYKKLKEYDIE
ncbi:MAG: sigma 54-interacting transcriptional regulator [Pontiellaceae bacterium]|nr:sigma 54-interacting transcriptional regulator [Pontiellaceae bacterium]